MKELVDVIASWMRTGRSVALARVVDVEGSGPRPPGAAMAVADDGTVAGSVSGGCVEAAVVTEALEVIAAGVPLIRTFGYSDDDAFAVGLTCGGTLRVFIERLHEGSPLLDQALLGSLAGGEAVATATVVEGPGIGESMVVRPGMPPVGGLGNRDLDRVVARDAEGQLALGSSGVRAYGPQGEARQRHVLVFVDCFAPPPRMVIFGAVDFTAALARVAKTLGYVVTVCDARPVFATHDRFPMADEVVVDRPERYLAAVGESLGPADAICVLTHDHKFDVPAIVAALRTAVGYLGAMGSRRTHDERSAKLVEAGVVPADMARLRSPIGLDLGARTPEETAVSICAEIIALRTGRAMARPLRDTGGPIHALSAVPSDPVVSPRAD